MKDHGDRQTAETLPSPPPRAREPITVRMRAVRTTVMLVGRTDEFLRDALLDAGLVVTVHPTLTDAALEPESANVIVAVVTSTSQLPQLARLCELAGYRARLVVLSDCVSRNAADVLARVSGGRYRLLPLMTGADEVADAARNV